MPQPVAAHPPNPIQAVGTEQRLVVADFFRFDLEHEVFHQHAFDLGLEFDWVAH